jgi:ribonucleotide monophosphatase NagD (HAD superfamily)
MHMPEKHVKDKGLHRVIIDLDGLLAEDTWPHRRVGKLLPGGLEILKHYFYEGYEVVIHTARPRSHEEMIHKWLEQQDISDMVYDVVCGKPQAWLYIDDRAWNPTGEEGWADV